VLKIFYNLTWIIKKHLCMKYIKQQICIFIFSLIYQRQESITIVRDLLTIASPLSYITQNKFIRSGLLDRVSVACRERQDWTAYSLLSVLKQVACTRHLLPDLKILSRSPRVLIEFAHLQSGPPRTNEYSRRYFADVKSPYLCPHGCRYSSLSCVLSLLYNYFLSEATAGIWPSARDNRVYKSKFGDSSFSLL